MQIACTKSVLNKKKNTSIAVKSPFDFLSCNCVILRTNKRDQINLVLFSYRHNKAFLVPGSCRATERNKYKG